MDMSTVQEIEDAIRNLSDEQLSELRSWFAEYDARMWNEQLERDVAAGRLDELADEALSDLREGRCTDLVGARRTPQLRPGSRGRT